MMARAYAKQAQIQAERAQRAADGKKGMGPIEKAHRAQTQANIAAREAENERWSRMSRKEKGEWYKEQERARHQIPSQGKVRKQLEKEDGEAEVERVPKNAAAALRQAEKAAANKAAAEQQAQRVGRVRAAQRDKAKAAAAAAIAAVGHKGAKQPVPPTYVAEGATMTARTRWDHVRHCEMMRHALASTQWSVVLRALRANDAELQAAERALEEAKAQVEKLDEEAAALQRQVTAPPVPV